MMKLMLTTALFGQLVLSPCLAYDITLNVRGVIAASGCQLGVASQSFTVDMGSVAVAEFYGAQQGGEEVPFQIQLKNCQADTGGARVSFSGNTDAQQPELLAIRQDAAAASGVGIALSSSQRQVLQLNQPGQFVYFENSGLKDQTLNFYARYERNGAPVRAGNAVATATFTLEYQ